MSKRYYPVPIMSERYFRSRIPKLEEYFEVEEDLGRDRIVAYDILHSGWPSQALNGRLIVLFNEMLVDLDELEDLSYEYYGLAFIAGTKEHVNILEEIFPHYDFIDEKAFIKWLKQENKEEF